MGLSQIHGWQSVTTGVGSRYVFMYVAQDKTAITSETVKEFERVVKMRPNVSVEAVQLLGRIIRCDIRVTASRTLGALMHEQVAAGGTTNNPLWWRAEVVYSNVPDIVAPPVPPAPIIKSALNATGAAIKTAYSAIDRVTDDIAGTITDGLGRVEDSIFKTTKGLVSAVVVPLIIPAAIGFAAYVIITRAVK